MSGCLCQGAYFRVLMKFSFCPVCGQKLEARGAGDDGQVPYCGNCRRFWFEMFPCCVIVMVVNEYGEIALLRQNYLSTEYATFVAGFMKPGENAEQAAEREVREELGLKIEHLEYAGTHWFGDRAQLMHAFVGYVLKGQLRLSSEVDAASWVPCEQAEALMFPDRPGNTQHLIFRQYMSKRKTEQNFING